MGIDLAYFTAPDDASAAAAEARPGGPLGWPVVTGTRKTGLFRKEPVVETLGPAYEGFSARGYDPLVALGTLEALLRGVEYDSLEGDPRWGGSPGTDDPAEGRAVLTVTDSLRDALSSTSDESLRLTAQQWAATEELSAWEGVTVDDHVLFLQQLRALSGTAAAGGHHLYCYFAV